MDFFDTNILVCSVDDAHPRQQAIARETIRQSGAAGELVISTQVMLEFYATMMRRQLMTHDMAVGYLEGLGQERVVPSTPELLLAAFELRRSRGFSVWDALIVQAALHAGCDRLFTEDLQHGVKIAALEIVNPFAAGGAVHEPSASYEVAGIKPARRRTRLA